MSQQNPKRSKNPTASSKSNLKASVSEKLLHLLGGDIKYNPDAVPVLTEYVVVLVSNGKSQSEAKSELEPFLGHTATHFVSWLWEVLSEASNDSTANMSSSDLENMTGASSTEADDDDDASAKNHYSQKRGSGVPKTRTKFPLVSNALGDETNNRNASALACKSNQNFRAVENNQDGSLKGCSFKTKSSDETLLADEQHVHYEKKVHERSLPLKRSQETNVGGRRLFSKAAGAIFLQKGINGTTRGNVWDRLGKRTENDSSLKVNSNEGDKIQRQTLEQNSLGLGQNTLMPTVEDNNVKQNISENCYVKTCRSNCGQKRQLSDFLPNSGSTSDSPDHEEENFRNCRRQSEKYTNVLKKSGNSFQSEQTKSYNKCYTSSFDASGSSRPEKISQEKFSMEALEPTETLISHIALPAGTKGIRPVQAQLLDIKLRLSQLETEISKLQSEPVNKAGEHTLSSSNGSVDQLKEGVESRTVFVTNVHVAAPLDALKSYFATCGAVTRVIKLSDRSTIKQKWSAYITFTSKESVDKALTLNGTYFFTRIIWVSKKI
ncbi:hypothetical protein PTKIN_Ptkin03bG0145300 [Pterospermum kingtungense]